MNQIELKQRTKKFALAVLTFVGKLPKTMEGRIIASQLLRSGTSVGANYRAACRARSKSEFVAKIGIVIEEADESAFWLEIILEGGQSQDDLSKTLLKEANEIVAIMTASRKSAMDSSLKRPLQSAIINHQS